MNTSTLSASSKALAVMSLLLAAGAYLGYSEERQTVATVTAARAFQADPATDPQAAAKADAATKAALAQRLQLEKGMTPFQICEARYKAEHGGASAGEADAACGNLHGADLDAIKQYEMKIHPLPLANCTAVDPATLDQPVADRLRKLLDACHTIMQIDFDRAQEGYAADQAKLTSEKAAGRDPGQIADAIIPGLNPTGLPK